MISNLCDFLRDPDRVSYSRDLGQLIFMFIATVWIIHSLLKGNKSELKTAIQAA